MHTAAVLGPLEAKRPKAVGHTGGSLGEAQHGLLKKMGVECKLASWVYQEPLCECLQCGCNTRTRVNTFGPLVQSLPSVSLMCLESGMMASDEDNKHQRQQLRFTRETETTLWKTSLLTS